ncbi:uncharacterized protein LY89DRAFT_707093 [Mollisia scopiformis]|uniref:Zn(2)-C6 fungal-type domain-containing protein n=1 Tax=Mollisia scopiformis TaxID=149040 RepID=A0A194XBR0_MOLSC|nr:uncharacterized protein LY89DRAFT_707093 [Mollisia scopiformis]KUJ17598.1 hypothetical protein LY89DRAFT_707093 [Mollisia scopiformis]
MPRPRVRPADRQRAPKACITCNTSKKRCDANLPCSLCVKKGRAASCTYPDAVRQRRRSRSPRVIDTQHSRLRERESESVVETRESSLQCSQQPTMLLSSRGEQVYIGNVAAISFPQFLQKTLKRYIGPSSFTDLRKNKTMLEVQVQSGGTGQFEDALDHAEKQDLIQCFLRVSNGILHLFSDQDISRLLRLDNIQHPATESLNFHPQRDDMACLYLMIAIGAQCRGKSEAEIKLAGKYFTKAQQIAFVHMLQDPSLAMIRIFLMMAFFMLGACRRNTAFLYIGIASKAAIILGLHISYQHGRASVEERAVRRRTWMSLRVLDLLCRDGYEKEDVSNEIKDHRTLALRASYESSAIIETIVQSCANSSNLDIKSAETFLQMLREWSQALPESLRNSPKAQSDSNTHLVPDPRELTIGNIHVSCTYYFGVILVTRQFLISRVMSQLRGRRSPTALPVLTELPADEREKEIVFQFSKGCISSAMFMTQLCYEACVNNILLDNMCLLKAWLFSAGLVLGFCLLVEEEDCAKIQQALNHARETLQKLSRLSPQAQQYYDILTSFWSAIELYREQLLIHQKPSTNPYVEQIMTFDEIGSGWQGGDQSQVPALGQLRTPEASHGGDDIGAVFDGGYLGGQLEMPSNMTQRFVRNQ